MSIQAEKRNTWINIKHILQQERSHYENAIYTVLFNLYDILGKTE